MVWRMGCRGGVECEPHYPRGGYPRGRVPLSPVGSRIRGWTSKGGVCIGSCGVLAFGSGIAGGGKEGRGNQCLCKKASVLKSFLLNLRLS